MKRPQWRAGDGAESLLFRASQALRNRPWARSVNVPRNRSAQGAADGTRKARLVPRPLLAQRRRSTARAGATVVDEGGARFFEQIRRAAVARTVGHANRCRRCSGDTPATIAAGTPAICKRASGPARPETTNSRGTAATAATATARAPPARSARLGGSGAIELRTRTRTSAQPGRTNRRTGSAPRVTPPAGARRAQAAARIDGGRRTQPGAQHRPRFDGPRDWPFSRRSRRLSPGNASQGQRAQQAMTCGGCTRASRSGRWRAASLTPEARSKPAPPDVPLRVLGPAITAITAATAPPSELIGATRRRTLRQASRRRGT